METIIEKLTHGQHSCVVANGAQIRTFGRRGIADLYHILNSEPSLLTGAMLADKVVGKAAAALIICGGVRELYAALISEPALSLLTKAGIAVRYETLVPHILNRDQTDWCPLEKSCAQAISVDAILPIIETFIAKLT